MSHFLWGFFSTSHIFRHFYTSWCQCSRLQWKTKEQQRALESEVADREKFVAEVDETVAFLTEAKLQLEQPVMLGADVEQVEQALEKQQVPSS